MGQHHRLMNMGHPVDQVVHQPGDVDRRARSLRHWVSLLLLSRASQAWILSTVVPGVWTVVAERVGLALTWLWRCFVGLLGGLRFSAGKPSRLDPAPDGSGL